MTQVDQDTDKLDKKELPNDLEVHEINLNGALPDEKSRNPKPLASDQKTLQITSEVL